MPNSWDPIYWVCPFDAHTCSYKPCQAGQICELNPTVRSVMAARKLEKKVKPHKDDPMTWEIKEY